MVFRCGTKMNRHSMSLWSSWPVLTQSKTILPCLHRIDCQANPSAPVSEPCIESERESDWTTIANTHWRSRYLIMSTDHSVQSPLSVFVLKGQFTQKCNTVIIYRRSVHSNTNVRHKIQFNFHMQFVCLD